MLGNKAEGRTPVNRPEKYGRIGDQKKQLGKANIGDQPPETLLFIPFTPMGEQKKSLQAAEKLTGTSPFGRVRIVETLGPKLNHQLANTAQWKTDHCGRENSHPCRTKEGSYKTVQQWKTSLARQIGEAFCFNRANEAKLMNSKIEWGPKRIPRVTVEDERPTEEPQANRTEPSSVTLPSRKGKPPTSQRTQLLHLCQLLQ